MMNDGAFFIGLFGIVYILMVVGGAITLLVILWRWMRAHEKLAASLASLDTTLVERWRSQDP